MAPPDLALFLIFARSGGLAFGHLAFEQTRLEHVHRGRAVLVLAAVVLAGHHDTGRLVGDPDRGIGRVDVLPARTRCPVGVDLEIGRVDLDVDIVVDHRIDPDRAEAGVTPRRAVIRAYTYQPVDAALGLGIAIGVLALDQQRRALDPGLVARGIFDRLDLEPAPFGPARIHAQQHLGPVLALGPAGTGIDLQIGIGAIRLARQ